MSEKQYKITIPTMPLYSNLKSVLKIWNNIRKESINSTNKTILSQLGTIENPVDWSNPDQWINERLSGEEAIIALKVWNDSKKTINPRYMIRLYNFLNTHVLLELDNQGIYHLGKKGNSFLLDDPQVVQEVDNREGILDLLNILSLKKSAKIRDLLPEWDAFLRDFFKYGKAQTSQEMLRTRLNNLIERKLVNKERAVYSITPTGLDYIKNISHKIGSKGDDFKRALHLSIEEYNQKQRKILKEKLSEINPFQFEHVVKNLLEEMGYENVIVTKQTGDQGVDVVGTVQMGISTITEVVQVKRHKANIPRHIIDQLRGALPYHDALRGTIITTGNFSKGCEQAALFRGAYPITLIDGERLLDLLINYQIGISRKSTDIFDINENYFMTTKEDSSDYSGVE
jgi:restriction system protein